MAERYTREEAPLVIHPTETSINEHFNKLIYCLNQRREEMIHQFRERMGERRAAVTTRQNMLQQLIDSKADLQGRMKENPLHSMRERMTEEIDTKMRDLQVVQRETEVLFECDTTQLEQTISVLGQLVEMEIVSTPDYPALQQPSISVAKEGTAEGELFWPNRVAFDEKSQRIYVTNTVYDGNSNISVFSVTGEYIDRVCESQVSNPCGIAISGDNVFVCDVGLHCVLKFKFPTFIYVSKVGKEGTGVGEFRNPHSLTVADGYVYVANCFNNRIVVMSTGLQHSNYITHQTMTSPCDVKVNNNKLFVLSDTDSPCLHVFSLTGEKIRSLITRDTDGNAQVRRCFSFCLDNKSSVLHLAVETGKVCLVENVVYWLPDWVRKEFIDLQNGCGNTAVHIGVAWDRIKCVELLLACGAGIWQRNAQDELPSDYCQSEDMKELIAQSRRK